MGHRFASEHRSSQGMGREPGTRDERVRAVAGRDMNGLLVLQRSAGNRAVNRLLQVQRYRTLDPGGFQTATGDDTRRPFMAQGEHMEVVDRKDAKPGKGIRFPLAQSNNPRLHVAGDNSLAINGDAGEPKDFFASAAVVGAANTELAAVNSPIELFPVGNTVRVPRAGETPEATLDMVQPKLRGQPPPGAGKFAEIGCDVCRDMAKSVMGEGITHAILGTGENRGRVPISVSDPTTVSGMLKLAEGLSNGNVSLEEAQQRLGNEAESPPVGKAYGEALKAGRVDERSRDLGINERAKAGIGEGYTTQTIPATDEQGGTKQEFSVRDRDPFQREFVWGYHFGAVIAESGDKKDQILLENYARKTDLKEGQALLLSRLQEDFRDRLRAVTLTGDLGEQIGAILIALGDTATTARQAWTKMYVEEVGKLTSLWYFRIVGEGAGQSFHEQMAGSGYFANPMTVGVAHQQFRDFRVEFDRGSETPNQVVINLVKKAAKGALADMHQDAFPGQLAITGYRSQTWSPWEAYNVGYIGQRRANAVGNLFRAEGVPNNMIVETDAGGTTKFGDRNDVVEVKAEA
jgi:outer membrane protein OmpA-like peptidoglycan-associated protein